LSSNRKEKYSLLTLAPASWTQAETASYFGVSLGATAKASALKRENGGILPNVTSSIKRKGSVTEGKSHILKKE
jgi:hypothetical protein